MYVELDIISEARTDADLRVEMQNVCRKADAAGVEVVACTVDGINGCEVTFRGSRVELQKVLNEIGFDQEDIECYKIEYINGR